jgi:hypothetical protein
MAFLTDFSRVNRACFEDAAVHSRWFQGPATGAGTPDWRPQIIEKFARVASRGAREREVRAR